METPVFRRAVLGTRLALMAIVISLQTSTKAGGGTNQDRVTYFEHAQGTVVLIADGAGGQRGGGIAADCSMKFLRVACARQELSPETCSQLLGALDSELCAHRTAGESTAVMAIIGDDMVFGASVGDSEAWLVQGGKTAVLTGSQYRKPLLGSGAAIPVEFGPVPFAGTLVIGTDGLFNYVRRDLIIESVGSMDKAQLAENLSEAARMPAAGFQDDTTVVVCSRHEEPSIDGHKLLLVENHPVFAETVTREFLSGYDVFCVATICEATSLLGRASFSAVLVDYDLDDGKGVELVEAAKNLLVPPIIVAISAHDAGNEALMKAGADAICKKVRFQAIGELLDNLLKRGLASSCLEVHSAHAGRHLGMSV